jgi:2-hydroxy-3-keto-5-methylthiopentenyl-1-phosphate phosphatase
VHAKGRAPARPFACSPASSPATLGDVVGIDAVLVDFDGTACSVDVSARLLIEFGDPTWREYDAAVDRGDIGLREAIQAQSAMIDAQAEVLKEFAIANCPLDPTFAPFVSWLSERNIPVAIVSDGFGFYVGPILEAVGLGMVSVITNEQVFSPEGRPSGMRFVNGNPDCIGCGTCKMLAVRRFQEAHGAVAFIGEGSSDRYGALYSDLVFAKDALPDYCRQNGVPYVPWNDFDDVRKALEDLDAVPGPVAPTRCPGWIDRPD